VSWLDVFVSVPVRAIELFTWLEVMVLAVMSAATIKELVTA